MEVTISQLNDDCMTHIFKKLSLRDRVRLEIVSKQWQRCSWHSWSTAKNVDLTCLSDRNEWALESDYPREKISIDINTLEQIIRRHGHYFTRLSIFDMKLNNSPCEIISSVSENCMNLQKIHLELNDYSDNKSFHNLFLYCEKLQTIEINNSRYGQFDWEHLRILPNKEKITAIALSANRTFKFSSLPSIIKELPNLRELILVTFELNSEDWQIIKNCHLTSISLSYCTIKPPSDNNIGNLQNIKSLEIRNSINVTDEVLHFFSNCIKLKSLTLEECPRISMKGLSIMAKIPTIEILTLIIVAVSGDYLGTMKSLKNFTCADCDNIHEENIIALIQNVPNLEFIDVVNINVTAKILKVANIVTRQRTNGITLEISVDKKVEKAFHRQRAQKLSPLLRIT